jgi:SAM-dependent methyltransferase
MYLVQKIRNVSRAFVQLYGSESMKRALWNHEFAGGRWSCLEDTRGDCLYPYVEKYARNGNILDLGCGSGNTGIELDEGAYQQYTGVDISDAAIEQAKKRTEDNRRANKNSYFQSDILSYVPTQQYEVILFREAIYYLPRTRVRSMLDRYSKSLTTSGVFIARILGTTGRTGLIVDIIESNFEVVEKYLSDQVTRTAVIVFRPRTS